MTRSAPGSVGRQSGRRSGLIRLVVLIAVVGLVLSLPLLAPQDPNAVDLSAVESSPSREHLLGADGVGRDILSRLLVASPISLSGPLAVVVLALSVGTLLALLSVWFPRGVGSWLRRVMDIILAFPSLLLAIVLVAILGKGLVAVVLALSLAYTPYVYRLVGAELLRLMHEDFVAILQLQGIGRTALALRHLLPNLAGMLSAQATINVGYALADLAAMSFLGLAIQPPQADWGSMIASGYISALNGAPWEVLAAGCAVALTIVTCVRLGDRMVSEEHGSWAR